MSTRRVTLYPTPENYQFQGEPDANFSAFLAYFSNLVKKVSASELATMRVEGLGGLRITYEHTLTPVEEYRAKLDALREAIAAIPADKIDREVAAALLSHF